MREGCQLKRNVILFRSTLLETEAIYYLAKATYDEDKEWGKGFKCVSVKATSEELV